MAVFKKKINWNDLCCVMFHEDGRNILVEDIYEDTWEEWLESFRPGMTEEEEDEWVSQSPPLVAKMHDLDGLLINPGGIVVGLWCDIKDGDDNG